MTHIAKPIPLHCLPLTDTTVDEFYDFLFAPWVKMLGVSYERSPSGEKQWTFAGSDEGGRRAAAIYSLIATAKLNEINPQAWLADVLARLPDHPAKRIHDLMPWNWRPRNVAHAA